MPGGNGVSNDVIQFTEVTLSAERQLLYDARSLLDSDPAEAERRLDKLIDDGVELAEATLAKGIAILNRGDPAGAAEFFMNCGLNHPGTYVNAAVAYARVSNTTKEMEALTKLLDFPGYREHENSFRRLASWAFNNKSWHTAYRALKVVFEIDSNDYGVVSCLAQACSELKKYKECITYALKGIEGTEDQYRISGMHALMAGVYKNIGEQQRARFYFNQVYAAQRSTDTASNLIMHMQYTHGVSMEEFYSQCREYSARFLRNMPRFQFGFDRLQHVKADTGLRIGWVSGDFVAHSLANLMLEPFRRFKALGAQHTHICYCSREPEREDKFSEKFKDCVDIWRNVHGKSDLETAKEIYADNVDVLIDLAGHTAYNRLPVFGYKPAPVQMGWISGMMTPPAIETIHYFFTDKWMRPKGSENICAETLIELPAAYTYFPLAEAPAVAPLPADRKGYITFGSFNNPCKISDAVLDLWTRSMHAVPNSRIEIKVYSRDHERALQKQLRERGIDDSRVKYMYQFPKTEDLMQHYTEEIDIVLDTFPCSGCLTSAEAMWMGVPVMTLVGDTFLHNQTWTIVNQIGLADELGDTEEDGFVDKVSKLCENRPRLREIRKGLRDLMEMAPIRDPEAIANGLLRGIEHAWRDWCDHKQPLQRLQLYGGLPRVMAGM